MNSNIIRKENRLSGLGLLAILIFITLICIVINIIFERYMKNTETKIFFRIMLGTILLNILILVFLVFSFSRVQFLEGPRGPQGLRGRKGNIGIYDTVAKCKKQSKTLADEYQDKLKKENIVIQRPILGFNDKY